MRRGRNLCAGVILCAALLTAAEAAPPAAGGGKASGGGQATASVPPPGQPVRIPLEPIGFQPMLEDFLLAGVSGLTVDFVDNDHLLVTFNTKHLMKREPDEQPQDDDRTVEAVLVELPSGKALARTEWRLHDGLEYLWNVGHGRFLLRVRDRLMLLAPMASIDPFHAETVLDVGDRHIVALLLSSDKDLLTLETTRRVAAPAGTASNVSFAGNDEGGAVQINFFRLIDTPEGLAFGPAGVVRAPVALAVPMTTAGILDVLEGGKNRWLFNFNEHAGKVHELAEWDTACAPHANFVGQSEFVAFGCRGSEDKPEIAGFNIKGEQMWEQGLYDSYVSPGFAFAPAAGRFALERTIVSIPLGEDAPLNEGAVVGEEVRVYQTWSGKVLLKVNTSPVERAGGNYALSADGTRLAVFEQTGKQRTTKLGDPYTETATSLVVYPLPPLTDQDRASLKEMEAKAPVDTGARVDASLERLASEDASGAAADRAEQAAQAKAAAAAPGSAQAGAAAATADATAGKEPGNPAMNGQLPNAPGVGAPQVSSEAEDGTPSGARQPPTLYQPGESPQGKSSPDAKQ